MSSDAPSSKALPKCPRCGAEDAFEHVKVEAEGMNPEAHYDICQICDLMTEPE